MLNFSPHGSVEIPTPGGYLMEWLSPHTVMIGTVLTAASPYVLFALQGRRERDKFQQQREGAESLPAMKVRENQRDLAIEILIHETQIERRFSTIHRAFPEFTADETRGLLREVGGRMVMRKDGSEWWHHRSRDVDLVDRHRARKKNRPAYAPPETRAP
ncbi:hypothetical protein MK280_01355 [Myxococcota bacterium]|nr:hypothetical protein [Myxococcota bacterium]